MKFFVVAATLVAAVAGEADPALVYGGLALPYAAYGAYPYAAAVGLKSAPCVNAANVPVPCAAGHVWKREAEAEADPALLYGAYGYAGALPYAYGAYPYAYGLAGLKSAPCVNAANIPVPCAGRKRREAEAEADPALLYSAYGYAGALPYAYAAAPAVATVAAAAPAVATVAAAAPAVVAAAPAATVVSSYAGAPHAVAATPLGLTHSANVGVCTNYLGAQVPC